MSAKKVEKDVPGFRFVQRVGDIIEYTLISNGLRVLLLEDDSTPTATIMVTYHVGSRNEVLGATGSTHILEHLLFKGSERFNKDKGNNIDYVFDGIGAHCNATTWFDRTNYYELIPSVHLPLAIAIEADRMRHAIFSDADLASEMTVVRNEYERGENSPFEALEKGLFAAAFHAHPYHHSTIGWRSDIENATATKLRTFYDHFYWPNNATVSIIGNFDTLPILASVREEFGRLERSPHEIVDTVVQEPPQEGERRFVVRRHEEKQIVAVAYKIPPARSVETYPLSVLAQVLGAQHTGRLYKALVGKGLATELSVFYMPNKDESLMTIYATLTDKATHGEVESIIERELALVRDKGVTADEVKRAFAVVRAAVAFERDGSYAIASSLNEALATGDWTRYPTFLDRLILVRPKEVQEVAKKTFVEQKRVVGYFVGERTAGKKQKAKSKRQTRRKR